MYRFLLFASVAGLALAANKPKIDAPMPSAVAVNRARTVYVSKEDIIELHNRIRFETLILLPKGEMIIDTLCGDKENWPVEAIKGTNFAVVKPAIEGSRTNLSLVTENGNVYSFTLTESASVDPDLKVFVEAKPGLLASIGDHPRFVPSQEVATFKEQAMQAQASAVKAQEDAEKRVASVKEAAAKETTQAKAKAVRDLSFDYKYKPPAEFNIAAIYHDKDFTYILANPKTAPVLHAYADGKPALVEFQYDGTVYFVPQILDHFSLTIGKKSMEVQHAEKR